MGQKLDLNKLRDIVHDNERRGDELPAAKAKKVFVDREGDVKLGDTVSDREARVLSEVPQSTFATGWPPRARSCVPRCRRTPRR